MLGSSQNPPARSHNLRIPTNTHGDDDDDDDDDEDDDDDDGSSGDGSDDSSSQNPPMTSKLAAFPPTLQLQKETFSII